MRFLSVREVATLLGIQATTIYANIYMGRIKVIKINNCVRISEEETERLLAERNWIIERISVATVAKMLGCSQSTILRLIHSGKLKARRRPITTGGKGQGNRFSIDPDDLQTYILNLGSA